MATLDIRTCLLRQRTKSRRRGYLNFPCFTSSDLILPFLSFLTPFCLQLFIALKLVHAVADPGRKSGHGSPSSLAIDVGSLQQRNKREIGLLGNILNWLTLA